MNTIEQKMSEIKEARKEQLKKEIKAAKTSAEYYSDKGMITESNYWYKEMVKREMKLKEVGE